MKDRSDSSIALPKIALIATAIGAVAVGAFAIGAFLGRWTPGDSPAGGRKWPVQIAGNR